MRYFIELSYNGKAYHGWQYQPNAISVQEVLEDALSKIIGQPIKIIGAGRTDAGVHALQMFAHFDINEPLEKDIHIKKLNAFLPKDIAVKNIHDVTNEAHARFDAIDRTYTYCISSNKNVFTFDQSYYIKTQLDIEIIKEATKILIGKKNYQCFSKSHTDVKTYICNIKEAEWNFKDQNIIFTIKADRFLRNMVRAIVGTLLDIGFHKLSILELKQIIELKNRTNAGPSVPAHALYLAKINYPNSVFIN